jgi:hypothetical protein
MSDISILYYSDSRLDPVIEKKCVDQLKKASEGKPIISVTQKPLDLGKNICVGDIGSSWLNLYKQLKIATENAQTKYVAMAEADVLYTAEFFNWVPPRDDTFYYNENCWFVQWGGNHPELNGMYSTFWGERKALSQLVCSRDILLKDLQFKLDLLDEHEWAKKSLLFAGEPGVTRIKEAQKWAKSGHGVSIMKFVEDYLESQTSDIFRTIQPVLDVRHSGNFTGPKRGKNRTYTLEPWGDFKEYMATERVV